MESRKCGRGWGEEKYVLQSHELKPIRLKPKEGLAFFSSSLTSTKKTVITSLPVVVVLLLVVKSCMHKQVLTKKKLFSLTGTCWCHINVSTENKEKNIYTSNRCSCYIDTWSAKRNHLTVRLGHLFYPLQRVNCVSSLWHFDLYEVVLF